MNNFSIGIIDSGSGGLSIWKEITRLMPNESTIYIGDHKYLPYSDKSTTTIKNRVVKLINFLLAKQVKLIVVACNTATVAGISWYRKKFPTIPIIGVVPVIKTAAAMTKTNEICILSTKYTASSIYQKRLIKQFASHVSVISISSSRLVEYIESLEDTKMKIIKELQAILKPIKKSMVDVLVLGCTHFPFIKEEIRQVIDSSITLLDSGSAVARHVKRILEHNGLIIHNLNASHVLYTTGDTRSVSTIYKKLLNHTVVVLPAAIA